MSTADTQSILWGGRARDWANVQEGMVLPLYQTVLARVQIGPGTALLDIGCGAGLFCKNAAGKGATISGIDATGPLLEIARERVPTGDFRVGDMEDLPYADRQFDVVTGFNSFQFAGSPLNALRQARRVLRPEGSLIVAVWGNPKDAEIAPCLTALAALLPPPPPGSPGPFALSGEGVLEPLAIQAGFIPGRTDVVDCNWVYPDFETLCRGVLSSGPGAAASAEAGDEVVRQTLAKAAAPFRTAHGSFEFRNKFRYLLARERRRVEPR